MIKIDIPGTGEVEIHNIIFDYNGTLALGGKPVAGVIEGLKVLSRLARLYIVTADTYGTVRDYFRDVPVNVVVVDQPCGTEFKKEFLKKLGPEITAVVGNGRNDLDMVKESCLSIGVIGEEGCFGKTAASCDIIVTSPLHALHVFLNTNRIKATLRY
ncbi:MAG: hypothetical protein HPY66_0415 [Firmicutes bacterium]|nr:hypothetical protein [Bacillota bacterium]MDI6705113.1 hypothetical protein [Bacillota bacterium]